VFSVVAASSWFDFATTTATTTKDHIKAITSIITTAESIILFQSQYQAKEDYSTLSNH
jgi:hypothetical protein